MKSKYIIWRGRKKFWPCETFKYVTIGRYTSDTITIYTFIHNKYQAIICSMKISYLLFNTLLYISLIKRLVKKNFILNSIQIVKFSINYTFLDILSDHESVYINRERSLWKLSCLIDWLIDCLIDGFWECRSWGNHRALIKFPNQFQFNLWTYI